MSPRFKKNCGTWAGASPVKSARSLSTTSFWVLGPVVAPVSPAQWKTIWPAAWMAASVAGPAAPRAAARVRMGSVTPGTAGNGSGTNLEALMSASISL